MPQDQSRAWVIPEALRAAPAALLTLMVGLTCPGCQSTPATPDADTPLPARDRVSVELVEPRIDAIAGKTVLTPVRLIPPITPGVQFDPRVAVNGDEPLAAELLWISRAPAEPPASPDPLSRWLGSPDVWSARTTAQLIAGEPPPGIGFWALLIDLPASAHQRALFIDGRAAPAQWLSPRVPETLRADDTELFRDRSPELSRLLSSARRDPLNRWRVRLLDDRLHAPRRSVIEEHAEKFVSRAIETMADQAEWRWRLALDRASVTDPFLGAELLDRLTAVTRFSESTEAPVWPTDQAQLTALRTALLDPGADNERVRALVRDALDRWPDSTAWVIDDAGWAPPGAGRTVTIIGVAERAGIGGLTRAGIVGAEPGPRITLTPFGVARPTTLTPVYDPEQLGAPVTASVDVVGRRPSSLPLLPLGLPVEPPGFRLGPGFATWTLDRWSAGAPEPAPPGLSFYALLHLRADASASWQLHIECPTAPGADPGQLRIFLGPSNTPRSILRIDPAGLQQDLVNTPLERDAVAIERTDDAWIATINIPADAIEAGGILRLGIERFDASGARATWPRPVLPWQESPGRAALDVSAWNSPGTAPGH
ncbi:MAG: hypothetical protein H6814_05770 [Phycisphaeraceae bacterium]|nr:hypothetical protein [Phycisphaeraceae bacterium]